MSLSLATISTPNRTPDITFNQRFANVGKTRSGKSTFAVILADLLVPFKKKTGASDPQIWWMDTKHDPADLERLQAWGYSDDKKTKCSHRIFHIYRDGDTKQWQNAQLLFARAFATQGILVVVDEYRQCVPNTISPGDDLLDVFTRGGGLGIGIIGGTQEPVYVPRQLLSQASHQFFFDLSYPNDIKRIREFYEMYDRPLKRGESNKHGFFHVAVDYDGYGAYYPHAKNWVESNELMKAA
jgi:hypothetical protein